MNLVPLLLCAGALLPPRYAPGERMGFSINYLGMRMGTASISVLPAGEKGLPVRLEAHTTGLAGSLFSFREELISHLEPESGLPRLFVIDTTEGNWHHHDTTDFDHAAGKAVLVERGKRILTKPIEIPPDALDFVALVFQLRRMPLEPGLRHTFTVVAGTNVQQVIVEVMERETVATKAGVFPALKIRVPTGFSGKFSERNPTFLWLSDDPRRIVVRISTEFSFGAAQAELLSYTPGEPGPDPDTAQGE